MDALPSREKSIQEMPDYKPSSLLTIYELLHVLDESVDNSEGMSCSILGLLSCQPVKPLQDCRDVLLLEKFRYEFDCVVVRKVTTSARTDSLDRRCFSSSVTRASVEINSTKILTTISSIAGTGRIPV